MNLLRSSAPPARLRVRAVGAAAATALALLLLGAPGASAHDQLLGSTPADGAVLAAPPASVDLQLSEPAQALGTQVSVTGPDGQEHAAGAPQLVDATVSQPLDTGLAGGDYRVVWRVTSSDGHPISGELAFTVTAPAATAEPSPEPSMTTQATPEPSPTTAGEDAATSQGGGGSPVSGATGALLALGALGAVVAILVRARRQLPPQD